MSYKGAVYQIPCSSGGFNDNPNIDIIPPQMMVEPSRNINIHEGGKAKRGGTAKINSTAITDSPRIAGLIDYTLTSGTQYVVTATADGKIYKNSTSTIKTGLTAGHLADMVVYGNKLYHTNGYDTIQVWDGAAASTSNLANPAADWGAGDQPKQLLVYGKGASERLWALNSTDQPQRIYATGVNDDDFVTNVFTLDIDTGDGIGIVGAVKFQSNLWLFGDRSCYILDDASTSVSDWGYVKGAPDVGVAHHRLICKTPNDVLVMDRNGDIHSIVAVQQTGDFVASSVARPAHIDKWIRRNIKLDKIAQFHSVYDPIRRAVLFWMVSNASDTVDICLPFFIDRQIDEAWGAPMDNSSYPCGYHASCATTIKTTYGDKVYTGDYAGFVWELETNNANDDGNACNAVYRTPKVTCDNPISIKHFAQSRIIIEPEGIYFLKLKTWIDNNELPEQQISLAGAGATLDSFVLDTDELAGAEVIDSGADIRDYGKRIQHEFYNNNVNETFFLSNVLIPFRDLGVKHE